MSDKRDDAAASDFDKKAMPRDVEKWIMSLLKDMRHASYLVRDLDSAVTEAGIDEITHPQIVERIRELRNLFGDVDLADKLSD